MPATATTGRTYRLKNHFCSGIELDNTEGVRGELEGDKTGPPRKNCSKHKPFKTVKTIIYPLPRIFEKHLVPFTWIFNVCSSVCMCKAIPVLSTTIRLFGHQLFFRTHYNQQLFWGLHYQSDRYRAVSSLTVLSLFNSYISCP